MSKKMKSAYSALRMKDMMIAVIEGFKPVLLTLFALALLCCNTSIFRVLAVVAAVECVILAAFRVLAAVFDRRMHRLGFDEVELERLALA